MPNIFKTYSSTVPRGEKTDGSIESLRDSRVSASADQWMDGECRRSKVAERNHMVAIAEGRSLLE